MPRYCFALVLAFLICGSIQVPAAELIIDDAAWATLPPPERDAIMARLKASRAIDAGDVIVYRGPEGTKAKEANTGILVAAKKVAEIICSTKHAMQRSACGDVKDAPARKSCHDAEMARYNEIKSAC